MLKQEYYGISEIRDNGTYLIYFPNETTLFLEKHWFFLDIICLKTKPFFILVFFNNKYIVL